MERFDLSLQCLLGNFSNFRIHTAFNMVGIYFVFEVH